MLNQQRLSRSLLILQEIGRHSGLRPATRTKTQWYRELSTQRDDNPAKGSIFSSDESAWDHLFKDLDDTPSPKRSTTSAPRRQTMTESERKTLRELLDQVFITKQDHSQEQAKIAKEILGQTEELPTLHSKYFRKGKSKDKTGDDVIFDQLQEEMAQCHSKAELLNWSQKVFAEFQRLSQPAGSSAKRFDSAWPSLSIYSRTIPKLMEHFREQFGDPNLALFIYKYTRNLSTASYVYGCTTATYNELLTTFWDSFRDLKTIRDILDDMKVNSVAADRRTEIIVERACREASEGKLWLDRSPDGDQLAMAEISIIFELLTQLLATTGDTITGSRKHDWKLTMGSSSKKGHVEFDDW